LFLAGYSSVLHKLLVLFIKDKPNKAAFYANPLSELSQKSLNRRTSLGIALNDQDAPIEQSYIQISEFRITVTDYSKWLNGVAVNAINSDKRFRHRICTVCRKFCQKFFS
jgi:hypothetical protein